MIDVIFDKSGKSTLGS